MQKKNLSVIQVSLLSLLLTPHPCASHFEACPRHFAEDSSKSADDLMSDSWEWREGRLLAYELILKFLITNHIYYVFPTFILPTSKHTAASSSVDETLIGRYDSFMILSLCGLSRSVNQF